MSACETCWNEAWRQAQMLGGTQVEHYQRLIAEMDHHEQREEPTDGR